MKIFNAITVATSLLLISFASNAAPPPPIESGSHDEAPPAAASAPAVEEPRQICRMEKQIGSNRATRICRSVEQIERDRESVNRHTMPRTADRDMSGPSRPG